MDPAIPPDTDRQSLLEAALAHHGAGRLDQAEAIYKTCLAIDPQDAEVLHLSGLSAQARGDTLSARRLLDAAVTIEPANPLFRNNRAALALATGDLAAAEANIDAALAALPNYPAALRNRGDLLKARGDLDGAGDQYRAALRLNPADALCWHQFGLVLVAQAKLDQAIDVFAQALSLAPSFVPSLNARADALHRAGRFDEAEDAYRQCLGAQPEQPDILTNLGTLYQAQGRLDEAIICYRGALARRADNPVALYNLGAALKKRNALSDAIACYREALRLEPQAPEILTGLASALQAQGKLDEAIPLYHRALDIDPHLAEALNNLMFALCAHPDTTGAELLNVTRARVRAGYLDQPAPIFANPRDPDRIIKIGYVSPDFRHHPVGYFLGAVLPVHDPAVVDIHCYNTSRIVDDTTRRLRAAVPHWHDVAGFSDADLGALIRDHGIDLLIDLSGHMADHRLGVFATRAAPVQASWLGYFSTTAIPRMDYMIADARVIPPGEDHFYTESVARLPGCYLCFDGTAIDLPVSPPPVESAGHITFGCLNRRDKLNPPLIRCWAEILQRTPGSRLLLKTSSFSDPDTRAAMIAAFADLGIDPARLRIEGHSDRRAHLEANHGIDIALDPFPYGGATTTAETLWMGVPLITLRGHTFVGRVGASMLSQVGHPELIAETIGDYVDKSVSLASDLPRLATVRAGLRERTQAGLCDGPRFATDLEAVFRQIWRGYCSRTPRG